MMLMPVNIFHDCCSYSNAAAMEVHAFQIDSLDRVQCEEVFAQVPSIE